MTSSVRSIVLTSSLLAILPCGAAAQVLGYPVTSFAPTALALATADLDRDGHVDLAIVDRTMNVVSIHPGDGLLRFGSRAQYPVGQSPSAVAIDDFNADGLLDLVTADAQSNRLSVLLATAPGVYGAAVPYATGAQPNSIAIGDFNGDGLRDLASANGGAGNFTVWRGTGSGTFSFAGDHVGSGVPGARGVVAGDWNGDGRSDLAMSAPSSGEVAIYLSLSSGILQSFARTLIPVGGQPGAIAVGDLNLDGRPDLIVAEQATPGAVRVLLGAAGGTFTPLPPVPVQPIPRALAIADFNADGKPDLAVACRIPTVLFGDGLGGFGSPDTVSQFPSAGTTALAVADVDHDGHPDFVTDHPGFPSVFVYPGRSATFEGTTHVAGSVPHAVTCADMNRDGHADVVTANAGAASMSVLLNDGAGGFGTAQTNPTGADPTAVTTGDLDADGWPDVVIANWSTFPFTPSGVHVSLSNGSGGFRPAVTYPTGGVAIAVAIDDVDVDGDLDVLALAGGGGNLVVLRGNGTGALAAPMTFAIGSSPVEFVVADFDGDLDPDVLVSATALAATLQLWLNDGTGAYALHSIVDVTQSLGLANALAAADVDGDGDLDVVATGANRTVGVFLGDGAGGLTASFLREVPANPWSIGLGDLDGDGNLDAAVTFLEFEEIAILLGDGHGGLSVATPQWTAGVQTLPQGIALADVDGDGSLDVVCGNRNPIQNTVEVLRNQGGFAFASGTPGCKGRIGTAIAKPARIGRADFGITVTNAPRTSQGTLLLATSPSLLGTPIPLFGVEFDVDLGAIVANVPLRADASGVAFGPLPLPLDQALVGLHIATQSLWLENPLTGPSCSTAFAHIVASRGLAIEVLR